MAFDPVRRALRAVHAPVYDHRIGVLLSLIAPHLRHGDRVLDVGCGGGALGRAILDSRQAGELRVDGLERVRRADALIPVREYDGAAIPWPDGSFDVAILADVLHHEAKPSALLSEVLRVSKRAVMIKDHLREGWLAQFRISVLDWAANAPYGVPCTFRYNDLRQWRAMIGQHDVRVVTELTSINVYPVVVNQLFGKGLHYFVVVEKPNRAGPRATAP